MIPRDLTTLRTGHFHVSQPAGASSRTRGGVSGWGMGLQGNPSVPRTIFGAVGA